ncbi:hypothetical protein ACTA71_005340 [Dictyostelium dimigraforme]
MVNRLTQPLTTGGINNYIKAFFSTSVNINVEIIVSISTMDYFQDNFIKKENGKPDADQYNGILSLVSMPPIQMFNGAVSIQTTLSLEQKNDRHPKISVLFGMIQYLKMMNI